MPNKYKFIINGTLACHITLWYCKVLYKIQFLILQSRAIDQVSSIINTLATSEMKKNINLLFKKNPNI